MAETALPQRFCLQVLDDAMAPLVNKGDVARLSTESPPQAGNWPVLVRTDDGGHYIRHRRVVHGDHWEAVPLNPSYAPLDSVRDGLKIIATMYGVDWATSDQAGACHA